MDSLKGISWDVTASFEKIKKNGSIELKQLMEKSISGTLLSPLQRAAGLLRKRALEVFLSYLVFSYL